MLRKGISHVAGIKNLLKYKTKDKVWEDDRQELAVGNESIYESIPQTYIGGKGIYLKDKYAQPNETDFMLPAEPGTERTEVKINDKQHAYASQKTNGARPKSYIKRQTCLGAEAIEAIAEESVEGEHTLEDNRGTDSSDDTSDYGTYQTDADGKTLTLKKAFWRSAPNLSKTNNDEGTVDLHCHNNFYFKVANSKYVQITPGNGPSTVNKTTVNNNIEGDCQSTPERKYKDRHISLLRQIRRTHPKVETELYTGGQKHLHRKNYYSLLIFKGSGFGCEFAAKMLFERQISTVMNGAKAYYLKTADEMINVDPDEKSIILVLGANGPTGSEIARLNGWYEVLKERMPTGIVVQSNCTIIMTVHDFPGSHQREHDILRRYSEYVIEASGKIYRPSSETKEKLFEALLSQKKLRVTPVKGGSTTFKPKSGKLALIDKEIADGVVPLLGSVRFLGKLTEYLRSDMFSDLNCLQEPIPELVQSIRQSFKEGGTLFLTLLAVYAHNGQLGVGRINQMRKMNESTEKFWQSADNIDKTRKSKSKKIQYHFNSLPLQHLYRYAQDHCHLMNLGNNIQKYVRQLDGKCLSEKNNVYRFSDGRVHFSFLLVYCEMYPAAITQCEDNFFFNFVKSKNSSIDANTDTCLLVDDTTLNDRTREVMKRFKDEILARHVAKCLGHQLMNTGFFKLFMKFLKETPHLLWKVLKEQDSDPKDPYCCIYHGLGDQSDIYQSEPRNITEVVFLHDIWQKKRKNSKWRALTEAQESVTLVHAIETSKIDTFQLMVSKGASIPVAALKKAMEIGAREFVDYIVESGKSVTDMLCSKGGNVFIAASIGNEYILKIVLEKEPGLVDVEDNDGLTPLFHAVIHGHSKAVQTILEMGQRKYQYGSLADELRINNGALPLHTDEVTYTFQQKRNQLGQSVLHVAAERGHTGIISLLLSHGFAVTDRDNNNETPLSLARTPESVETLLSVLDTEGHCSLKHQAIIGSILRNECDLLDVFYDNGCTFNFFSREYGTPIFVAIQNGLHGMIRYLLLKDANVEIVHAGFMPVHVAAANGDAPSLSILEEFGANIYARGANNYDIIHVATRKEHVDFVETVLQMPGSQDFLDNRDSKGNTALHIACENGNHPLTLLLLQNGYNSKLLNKENNLPLHLAEIGQRNASEKRDKIKWNAYADCVKTLQMRTA